MHSKIGDYRETSRMLKYWNAASEDPPSGGDRACHEAEMPFCFEAHAQVAEHLRASDR
jgi:hypothetical protein